MIMKLLYNVSSHSKFHSYINFRYYLFVFCLFCCVFLSTIFADIQNYRVPIDILVNKQSEDIISINLNRKMFAHF